MVATKLSATNSRDLLVSYSGAGVYLFDTDGEPEDVEPVLDQARRHRKAQRDEEQALSEYVAGSTVPEKRPREASESMSPDETSAQAQSPGQDATDSEATQSPPIGPHEHEAAAEGHDAEDSDSDDMFSRLRRNRRRAFHQDVPLVGPRHVYEGHLNESTVKDVNFMENHIVSGSDDGNFFVWNKDTEDLVAIYKGDDSVVNVLQPHPYLPLLAISGIDPTVKIFGPVANGRQSSNLVTDRQTIIDRNKARAGQEGDGEMLTVRRPVFAGIRWRVFIDVITDTI